MTTAKRFTPKTKEVPKPKPRAQVISVSTPVEKKVIAPPRKKDAKRKKVVVVTREVCGKCSKFKEDCECGRPVFDGKDVEVTLAKLEGAFSIGCTDEESCLQADISVDALYRYERANPEFRKRKHLLKEKLVLIARSVIQKAMTEVKLVQVEGKDGVVKPTEIPTDRAVANSWRYVEAKRRSEFGKVIGVIQDDGEGVLTAERQAQIDATMRAWDEPDEDEDDDEESDYEDSK
jgi:hypothetical protein